MKTQQRALGFFMAFFLVVTSLGSFNTQASTTTENVTYSDDREVDVVFVIQDTPEMGDYWNRYDIETKIDQYVRDMDQAGLNYKVRYVTYNGSSDFQDSEFVSDVSDFHEKMDYISFDQRSNGGNNGLDAIMDALDASDDGVSLSESDDALKYFVLIGDSQIKGDDVETEDVIDALQDEGVVLNAVGAKAQTGSQFDRLIAGTGADNEQLFYDEDFSEELFDGLLAIDNAPEVNILDPVSTNTTVEEGSSLDVDMTLLDLDNDTLTCSIILDNDPDDSQNVKVWETNELATFAFSVDFSSCEVGEVHYVTIQVSDGIKVVDKTFKVTVD